MKLFLIALLFPFTLAAQTISTQPANQVVSVGGTSTFTVVASGGPCRSIWYINGVSSYGLVASTFTPTFTNVTLAQNGTTVQIELYGCTGGSKDFKSNIASLTVTAAPLQQNTVFVNTSTAYDDASVPPVQIIVQDVTQAAPVTVLTLTPDSTGAASGQFDVSSSETYSITLFLNGQSVGQAQYSGAVVLALVPNISKISFGVTLFKATGLVTGYTGAAS